LPRSIKSSFQCGVSRRHPLLSSLLEFIPTEAKFVGAYIGGTERKQNDLCLFASVKTP
jgi:hypothetical protein